MSNIKILVRDFKSNKSVKCSVLIRFVIKLIPLFNLYESQMNENNGLAFIRTSVRNVVE